MSTIDASPTPDGQPPKLSDKSRSLIINIAIVFIVLILAIIVVVFLLIRKRKTETNKVPTAPKLVKALLPLDQRFKQLHPRLHLN